jgi:hypothetical protein
MHGEKGRRFILMAKRAAPSFDPLTRERVLEAIRSAGRGASKSDIARWERAGD